MDGPKELPENQRPELFAQEAITKIGYLFHIEDLLDDRSGESQSVEVI